MVKTLNILLVVLGLACFAQAVPSEDKVSLPIANYSVHNWYSGTFQVK